MTSIDQGVPEAFSNPPSANRFVGSRTFPASGTRTSVRLSRMPWADFLKFEKLESLTLLGCHAPPVSVNVTDVLLSAVNAFGHVRATSAWELVPTVPRLTSAPSAVTFAATE